MQRLTAALFLLVVSSASVGCTSYSVRPGLWELRFEHVIFSETEEPAELPTRRVRVLIDDSPDATIREVIEISPAQSSPDLLPMYADVENDRKRGIPKVKITHEGDPNWIWNMHGYVRSDRLIEGTQFHARHRYRPTALEGTWVLKWLSDA